MQRPQSQLHATTFFACDPGRILPGDPSIWEGGNTALITGGWTL
jgi:hypothetical protein